MTVAALLAGCGDQCPEMESATAPLEANPGKNRFCIYGATETTLTSSSTSSGNESSTNSTTNTMSTTDGTTPTTDDTVTDSSTTTEATDTTSTTNPQPGCGNGMVEEGEACDDGNDINTDDCLDTCLPPSCGDGYVYAGGKNGDAEACDGDEEGNAGETANCNEDCTEALCGDGKLNKTAGEECEDVDDGAPQDGDGCSSTCEYEPTRVFVTSEKMYTGDLSNNMMQDPLEYADAECQKYADAEMVELNGTFMAWLSDGTTGAFDRMPIPEGFIDRGIVLAAGDKLQVANSWETLLVAEPTLEHAIDTDEKGNQYTMDTYAWTHTSSEGISAQGVPCPADVDNPAPWTSGSVTPKAVLGDVTATEKHWTNVSSTSCQSTSRLYCFELPPPPEPADP